MAVLSTIAAVATVAAAGATVYSAVKSGQQQKKVAQQAAATEEANAQRAEENAEAWAQAVEQQTEFNYKEAVLDAGIVKERTTRDLAYLQTIGEFKAATYDRSITAQQDLLRLRGDAVTRDAEDEIAALLGQSEYQRGALTRRAAQTVKEASTSVLAARTRTAFEAANMEAEASETDTQGRASLRRAGVEAALGAMEQQQIRAQGERIAGATRAAAGKAGVALSGSTLDVLADQAGEAELQALAAKYQNDITVDAYVEDARSKGVRAVMLRGQANQVRALTELDAKATMESALFRAAELEGEAGNLARATEQSMLRLRHRRDSELAVLDRDGADRIAGLTAERDATAYQFREQISTTRLAGEQQEAAFRREAEQIKIKGEIDARNTRLTQMAAAADFRASAASRRESGSAAATAGYLSAGATLLNTTAKVATMWPTLFPSSPSTPGVAVGGKEPLTGLLAGGGP